MQTNCLAGKLKTTILRKLPAHLMAGDPPTPSVHTAVARPLLRSHTKHCPPLCPVNSRQPRASGALGRGLSGRQRTEAIAEQVPYLVPKLVCRRGGVRRG